jgi:hypothetical protein
MLANCTMADTLGAVKVQSDVCGYSQESKRTEMFMYTGIVYGIAILLVALRLAGKLVAKHLSLDDWIVVAALVLLALPVGCVLAMTKIGFGKHLWSLENGELLRILRFCKYIDFCRRDSRKRLVLAVPSRYDQSMPELRATVCLDDTGAHALVVFCCTVRATLGRHSLPYADWQD